MSNAPIVVVGTGLAGYSLVREIRKLDKEQPILMITQDDGHSYSKPMLSTGYTKGKSADELSMGDPGKMAAQLNVSIRTATTVTGIDADKKEISLGTETLSYSKLVLATGAIVNELPIPGMDSDKVVSINDLMDYRAFRDAAEDKDNILIMGGGLIGCEFANDLAIGGKKAAIAHPFPELLTGLIPDFAGKAVAEGLAKEGITLHLEQFVTGFADIDEGVEVTLSNGDKLTADLVISAVGLTPNTKLAESAGIDCDKGIKTNRFLATNKNDIYAIGDGAEVDGHVLLYVLPLMACARALAKTLCGEPTQVSYNTMPIATKTPACPVITVPPRSDEGTWNVEADGIDVKGEYKSADGELLGFVLTGSKVSEKQALTKLVKGIHQ